MRFVSAVSSVVAMLAACSLSVASGRSDQTGPYHILTIAKVGGDGGFDYVNCDPAGRRLYVARRGPDPRVNVFDLDSIQPVGAIPKTGAHGAVIDSRYGHGFCSSSPVTMFDTKTLSTIKTIEVQGSPDGMLHDPYNNRVYVLSHEAPNVTVIDAKDGSVLGTIDLGGAPEQAATDRAGHIYIDLEDRAAVAVVDANTMKMTGTFGLGDKGAGNAGLALDARNHVLFVACREPRVMVMISSVDGHYLASLPIGDHCDGVVFNPRTHEAFSSQGDGTLTVIKENSPTSFEIEETLKTMVGAKTCTFDPRTGRILLIAAEYGQVPTSAAGERPRRAPMVPGSFSVIVVGR